MNESYFNEDPANNSNGTTNTTSPKIPIIFSLQLLWGIYGSILLIFGVPGNLLVICVLQRELFRGIVSTFLTAVGVFDIIVLTLGVPYQWMTYVMGVDIHLISREFCLWLTSFSQSSANWLLVFVTAVRLFYLKSSVRRYRGFTVTKARVTIVLVVITLMITEYIMLHLRNIEAINDDTKTSGELVSCDIDAGTLASWLRHTIATYLPCLFLFLLTVWLIKEGHSSRELEPRPLRGFVYNFKRMLVLTNVVFLVANLPVSLYYSAGLEPYGDRTTSEIADNIRVSSLLNALLFTGFAVNVLVYSFSGKRFPSEMKEMCVSLVCRQERRKSFYQVTKDDLRAPSPILSRTPSSYEIFRSQMRFASSTEV